MNLLHGYKIFIKLYIEYLNIKFIIFLTPIIKQNHCMYIYTHIYMYFQYHRLNYLKGMKV